MGISEGWEGGEGIDCSVGTIVWVRRRNGSWWPGRILGSDELSESHLMSPRSGTPVKLLGREDASVDWYNLEKSKRVKAFRCGEFDDCIRRAESSQGIPPKKREKYARREDAIIHALELENQQYEKKRQKLGIGSNYWSNKMLGTSNRDLGSCSPAEDFSGNDKGRDHCRYINKKPHTLSKKPYSSLEEESMCNLLYVQKEEDMSSGLVEAQESDSSAGDYLDHDIEEDEALFSDPANSGRYISRGGSVYQVPMQSGNMDNEELDESELSSYVSQLQPHEQTAGIASDMGGSKWQLKGKRNIRNLTKRPMELIDGKDPVEIPDKCNVSIHQALCRDEGDIIKTTRINSRRALGRQGLHYRGEEFSYMYEEGGPIESDLVQTRMVGFVRRCPSMLKASSGDGGRINNSFISSDEDSRVISPSIWEAGRQSQETLRGYWEESDGCFDPVYVGHLGDQMEPMLLDVDLKVQASYQGEHVPLVSLMSKLNGKAIVGHPVQIEILEDGYSDFLLPSDGFCERLPDTDGNTAPLQVWRTARRTAMHRAPRPPSSAMEGEEVSTLQYSDLERKRPFKKRYAGHVKHKVRSMKGRISRTRGHRARKKKLLKKASLSSQKTRTLSSIAIEQKPARKNSITKLADKNNELHGLIKPETAPMVTCVPVKLVFSRIREAIGRPPLAAPSHRVLIADSAEWKLPS